MQDSTIEFSNNLPQIPGNAIAVNFREAVGGIMFIKMNYADTTFYIEFDSGNNKPLTLSDSLFMRSEDYKKGHYAISNGVIGYSLYEKNIAHSYRTVSNISLDGASFSDVVIEAQPSSKLLIGTPFIRNRETVFDWQNHKIYFMCSYRAMAKGEDGKA